MPVENEKRSDANIEYIVIYEEDGTITLIPKIENPSATSDIGELYEEDEWKDIEPEGSEMILGKDIIYGGIVVQTGPNSAIIF